MPNLLAVAPCFQFTRDFFFFLRGYNRRLQRVGRKDQTKDRNYTEVFLHRRRRWRSRIVDAPPPQLPWHLGSEAAPRRTGSLRSSNPEGPPPCSISTVARISSNCIEEVNQIHRTQIWRGGPHARRPQRAASARIIYLCDDYLKIISTQRHV